ncbi:MAG: V-type ATP synthase subunit F [Planctomycetota bacterium]|nr:MAG: V-type ATP synthase subunit F [Planctomycetota bacterium]
MDISELAVCGNLDFLVGFQLAGIKKMFAVGENDRFEDKLLEAMSDKSVGILIVRDRDMRVFPPHRRKVLLDSVRPVIISIGRTDVGDLRDKIRQAIGIDLY